MAGKAELLACFGGSSAGVIGEGRSASSTLFFLAVAVVVLFSCELEGSGAPLLGTGVKMLLEEEEENVFGFGWTRVLEWFDLLVDSLRGGGERAGDGEEDATVPATERAGVLEKKPRMLFCLPPPPEEDAPMVDCVFAGAGVRALLDLSAIVKDSTRGVVDRYRTNLVEYAALQ